MHVDDPAFVFLDHIRLNDVAVAVANYSVALRYRSIVRLHNERVALEDMSHSFLACGEENYSHRFFP